MRSPRQFFAPARDETVFGPRSIVLMSVAILFWVRLGVSFTWIAATPNGVISFCLTVFFALLILLRPKPPGDELASAARFILPAAIAGVLLTPFGVMFGLKQAEWLGSLLIMFACLEWALPKAFSRDIALSLFALYWAHPMPAGPFGALQTAMQEMSVLGAEWFLHILNVRVWADGLVLLTGTSAYEVPAWCNGMRTATTIFLLAFGLGFVKRLKFLHCALLAASALAQALALNVLRISTMITLAPRMGDGAGVTFLHDTAGLIVVAGVFLIYVEILLLERRRLRLAALSRELNPMMPEIFTERPPFWRIAFSHKLGIPVLAGSIVLAAGLAYKSRPYHHAQMIKDVAVSLRDMKRLDEAQRAAETVLRLDPNDEEWRLTTLRLALIRGEYEGTLAALDELPNRDETRATEKNILRAYCLMGLDRFSEAARIVENLPEDTRLNDARVAMVLAELALFANDPDEIAANIVNASRWGPNLKRVRALYPYLRIHRKWNAIADSDALTPYDNDAQTFSAVEAYMNLNKTARVADITLRAMAAAPEDPRVLTPLFFMAIKPEQDIWLDRFAAHLLRCARAMNEPEALSALFDKCFQLARPDLAWTIFRRINEIDPSHPSLYIAAVKHGDLWFSFRKKYLGINSPREDERIDLKPFFLLGLQLPSWLEFCRQTPLASELCVGDTVPARKEFLKKAVAEFRAREAEGRLSLAMQYECVYAIEMSGDDEGARRQLEKIALTRPESETGNRIALSEIYERKADWQNVYETLRGCLDGDNPQLSAVLRFCRACLNLKLNLIALHAAREATRLYPDSSQAAGMLATVLIELNCPEEALFVIEKDRPRRQRSLDALEAEALHATERFVEAQAFCRSSLLPPRPVEPDAPQSMFLPPAESSVLWHRVSIPSNRHFADAAEQIRTNLKNATSPFLINLLGLWLECYKAGCENGTADLDGWLARGRDRLEKASALNQLTLLLCWREKFPEALAAARSAAELCPESPILWRALVGLSGANAKVIGAARAACPDDPEIWLAELVTDTQQYGRTERSVIAKLSPMVNAVAPRLPAAAQARAAELLLRMGLRKAAAMAARDAVKRARGLLPVYALGIKCAIADMDREWAFACVKQAVWASLNPPPLLYQKMVELQIAEGALDISGDMVHALSALRREDPENPLWPQMLGYVRFSRGGYEIVDAVYQMTAALDAGATNKMPYIIAAEASRLLGNPERAVDLLRKGIARHPDNLAVLNNLAYTLALMPEGVPEALELLPRLLERATDHERMWDTIAVIYLRSGQFPKAKNTLSFILQLAQEGSPVWFRANMHLAEIALKEEKPSEADGLLKKIMRRSRGVPDNDILYANTLLTQCTASLSRKQKNENE